MLVWNWKRQNNSITLLVDGTRQKDLGEIWEEEKDRIDNRIKTSSHKEISHRILVKYHDVCPNTFVRRCHSADNIDEVISNSPPAGASVGAAVAAGIALAASAGTLHWNCIRHCKNDPRHTCLLRFVNLFKRINFFSFTFHVKLKVNIEIEFW